MNVLKHAEAKHMDVKLKCNQDGILLKIVDDGRGFVMLDKYSTRSDWSGFGITAMRERIDRHGGSLEIKSAPNRGTSITISIRLG